MQHASIFCRSHLFLWSVASLEEEHVRGGGVCERSAGIAGPVHVCRRRADGAGAVCQRSGCCGQMKICWEPCMSARQNSQKALQYNFRVSCGIPVRVASFRYPACFLLDCCCLPVVRLSLVFPVEFISRKGSLSFPALVELIGSDLEAD